MICPKVEQFEHIVCLFQIKPSQLVELEKRSLLLKAKEIGQVSIMITTDRLTTRVIEPITNQKLIKINVMMAKIN